MAYDRLNNSSYSRTGTQRLVQRTEMIHDRGGSLWTTRGLKGLWRSNHSMLCLDCSCQGSMSQPPPRLFPPARPSSGQHIYGPSGSVKCAHVKAECTGGVSKSDRTSSRWSLANSLGCSFTLLLLFPPLHCLHHRHLLGLLLLVPGFKLQPEDVRNGTIEPEIKNMHLRMIRRNASSPLTCFQ